jgi:multisubunit Na+/H+ antiporter MnhG subunit
LSTERFDINSDTNAAKIVRFICMNILSLIIAIDCYCTWKHLDSNHNLIEWNLLLRIIFLFVFMINSIILNSIAKRAMQKTFRNCFIEIKRIGNGRSENGLLVSLL